MGSGVPGPKREAANRGSTGSGPRKEFSSRIVEGLNDTIQLTRRKVYGFKTLSAAEIAPYHALGQLSEPELAHEFC